MREICTRTHTHRGLLCLHTQRVLLSTGSLLKWLQLPGLGQVKPRSLELVQISTIAGRGSSTGHIPLLSKAFTQGVGLEVEQPGIQPVLIGDAGIIGCGLTGCTTVLVPDCTLNPCLNKNYVIYGRKNGNGAEHCHNLKVEAESRKPKT